MKRCFQIYVRILKINFAVLTAYRLNTFSSILSTLGWGVFLILQLLLLTTKNSTVYGWTRNEILILGGCYSVIIALFYTLFSLNFRMLPRIIDRGELDGILLKPIDSQFLLSVRFINYTSLTRVVVGICFVAYMLNLQHITLTAIQIISFMALTVISIITIYSFWYLLSTLMIWFTRLDNLIELFYVLNGLARFPPDLYKHLPTVIFVLLLPITLILSVPVKVLLSKAITGDIWELMLCAFILFVAARWFWKFALRFYTSANG